MMRSIKIDLLDIFENHHYFKQSLIIMLGLLPILVTGYYFFLLPKMLVLNKLKQQHKILLGQPKRIIMPKKTMKKTLTQIRQLKQKIDSLQKMTSYHLINTVTTLIKKAPLALFSLSLIKFKKNINQTSHNHNSFIKIQCIGSYSHLLKFLERLKMKTIFSTLTLQPIKKSHQLMLSIQLETNH